MSNRLAREKSPYLLQHKDNPVDWYPWGEEAFARAKKEDKPILLSIGYSTCHWCHVMERESFENEAIAGVMNASFVCVKLDREERPDVDKVYMTAVQALTGQGGWPLNVFLTPELKPFYGGTYFPPEPRWGAPAWPALLTRISELWKTKRADIDTDAAKLAQALSEFASAKTAPMPLERGWLDRAVASYERSFDPDHGGFGGAPKFPMPVNQSFLLRRWAIGGDERAKTLALGALRAMASGGIYDQIGGGFHRYSTDPRWHVPHFEKMLYDNAQLALNYVEAFQADADAEWARVARETLDYLLRDMAHPDGGFYSAEDADSLPPEGGEEKSEGAFYLWTRKELDDVLGKDAEAFCLRYGIEEGGNAENDPHGEFTGKNIPYVARSMGKVSAKLSVPELELARRIEQAKKKLLAVRAKRPRPHLDDKVLASWNGLALTAFARAGAALEEPRYLEAARKTARFLKDRLWEPKGRVLWRRFRDGERAFRGTADDYAFCAQGALDLYEATFEPEWLEWSVALCEVLVERFEAEDGGFYLTEAGAKDLLMRVVEDSDNVEPSASSTGALTLLRLSDLLDRPAFETAAEKTLARFGPFMAERPLASAYMLAAADAFLAERSQVVVARPDAPGGAELLAELRSRLRPGTAAAAAPGSEKLMPWTAAMKAQDGRAAAYVCRGRACEAPVTEPAALARALGGDS